jgi:heptaprenylglyceryl phosphate synthase
MGENQSVDLSQNLDRLLTYISQLVPKDDSKFVEGMVKEIVYRFKEDKIGQELLMHLLESLPKTIDKYSDIMQKKRESKFGIGYLIKDTAKKAADVGLIDDIKYTKEKIRKKIEELKEIRDELYNTLITTSATLNEISAKSLKPNITEEEIKKL